ncbi:MAG: SPOR domain-containing protein [Flavobacteriaceae bacterium]
MNQYSILKTITTGIFIVFSSTISAQEKTSKIETSPAVKTLIERKIEINKAVFENQYYAIQLYYGNNTAANRILKEFKVNFPEWEAELSFETPNYKVRVGRFKDLNIASQKLEEIRKVYPSAFLLEPNNL